MTDRERAQAARECFYCASEPEPGWVFQACHIDRDFRISCPICNRDDVVPRGLKRRSR